MKSNNPFVRNVSTTLHKVLLTLKVFKKQFQNLIGLKHLGIRTDTLMNIFRNYITHKTKKFDYKTPACMNTLVISALKKGRYLLKGTIEIPMNIIRRHY